MISSLLLLGLLAAFLAPLLLCRAPARVCARRRGSNFQAIHTPRLTLPADGPHHVAVLAESLLAFRTVSGTRARVAAVATVVVKLEVGSEGISNGTGTGEIRAKGALCSAPPACGSEPIATSDSAGHEPLHQSISWIRGGTSERA